jgi:hypothetical protein
LFSTLVVVAAVILFIILSLFVPAEPGSVPFNPHIRVSRVFETSSVLESIRVDGNNEDAIVSGFSNRTVIDTNCVFGKGV